MNPKIIVGAVIVVFAGIVSIIAFAGQNVISDISEEGLISTSSDSRTILPIEIELEDISILEVTERAATLEIKFKVTNPNYKSVILQYIKYELFENDLRVQVGEIGDRPEGFVAGSNYFTILTESPTVISDKFTIKNTGNTPEFWSALVQNNLDWKVLGEAFFNLSSMTSGAENEITFEFTK